MQLFRNIINFFFARDCLLIVSSKQISSGCLAILLSIFFYMWIHMQNDTKVQSGPIIGVLEAQKYDTENNDVDL